MNHIKVLLENYLKPADEWKLSLIQQWPHIVGELHSRMRIQRVNNDHVIIGVYDIHWMHELFHMTRFITEKINNSLGGSYIKTIRFVLVKKNERVQKNNEKNIAEKPFLPTINLTDREQNALTLIHDNELRGSLLAMITKIKSH